MSLRSRRFASLLVGVCALALACSSASAHAGRASACKAPPFSVPKETQRAVDAAIDARITGAGAGGASSTVAVRTDYETTTLSQDAAARAWFEFTLCNKLAKKLISQELHDELLRGLLTPVSGGADLADPSPEPPPAPPSPSPPPVESLVGTWQVSSRFTSGSCPKDEAGRVTAYTWLISQAPGGDLEVSVQGRTSYPALRGAWTDGHLRLGGTASEGGKPKATPYITAVDGRMIAILARADFDLQMVDGELVGDRALATWSSRLSDDGAGWIIEPCVLNYEVRARR